MAQYHLEKVSANCTIEQPMLVDRWTAFLAAVVPKVFKFSEERKNLLCKLTVPHRDTPAQPVHSGICVSMFPQTLILDSLHSFRWTFIRCIPYDIAVSRFIFYLFQYGTSKFGGAFCKPSLGFAITSLSSSNLLAWLWH